MPLRQADLGATRRFEDGEDWLVLRTDLTKHDQDVIAEHQGNWRFDARALTGDPDADRDMELKVRVVSANRTFFGLLAVEWSIGKDKPTAGDYDLLDRASGRWVDECVEKVLAGLEEAEVGKGPSTAKPRSSRGSRSAAAK